MPLTPRQRLFRNAFSQLRVFPVLGWGGHELWQRFLSVPGTSTALAPHDCDLFLLAGEIPSQWRERIRAMVDTVARPRTVVWLRPSWHCEAPKGIRIHHSVASSRVESLRLSSLALELQANSGKAVPRQGHEAIQHVPGSAGSAVVLGPHFPGLPSGLQLELRLDGDRIRACEGVHNAFPLTPFSTTDPVKLGAGNLPALKVLLGRGSTMSAMESARWYNHISWMADFIALAGMPGAAAQLRPLRRLPDRDAFRRIVARVEPKLKPLCQGVGTVSASTVRRLGLSGPVARASGVAADARNEDAAYLSLGFEPVLETDGDAWARWRVHVRECEQSLNLIARGRNCPINAAEGPRGTFRQGDSVFVAPTTSLFPLLETRLRGLEWSQALLFIGSLDLSPLEAALQ